MARQFSVISILRHVFWGGLNRREGVKGRLPVGLELGRAALS